tara:strand:- start:430 stop:741 length:312 start_codon:yes stop_codon:yes gene_type:complete
MFAHIQEGLVFQSRTGSRYKVTAVKDTKFSIQSLTGRAPVTITKKRVDDALSRLKAGEELAFQKNRPQGGISYTVAIEAGVVFALGEMVTCDKEMRVFRRAHV